MKWFDWFPAAVVVVAVVALVVWFDVARTSDPADLTPSRACHDLAGDTRERLHACLGQLRETWPSSAGAAAISALVRRGQVLGIGAEIGGRNPLVALTTIDPEAEAMLLGTDEARAARRLAGLGFRGLVIHRDLVGALDRDRRVMARLAHHDHLTWFELTFASHELLVYAVRSESARLGQGVGDALVAGLRARLAGLAHGGTSELGWRPPAVHLVATLRLQGNLLALRYVGSTAGAEDPVEDALDDLARKLRREWDRKVEPEGHGALDARLAEVRIEVHVITEFADVEPRGQRALFELWELGIDGVMFRDRPPEPGEGDRPERLSILPGSEAVTRSISTADAFLRSATRDGGWATRRPWHEDPRTRLVLFRDQHFAERSPGGRAVRLFRGVPEVPLERITDRHAQDMLIAGGEWWLANERPDHTFEYKYWPVQNRRSLDYNEVRHILAARDLADVWRVRHDPRYLGGARRAMDWLLRFEVDGSDPPRGPLPHPPPETTLFRFPSHALEERVGRPANQKLGTVAVALLGWVAWAEATGSHAEDERIRRMARFVTAMQEPDGRFRPYYVHPDHAYAAERNDIVPGEAMLALGEVAEYLGEPAWIDGWDAFLAYYRPWFRERARRTVPTGRWPHGTYTNEDRLELVQFGPWSVMASQQVYELTGRADAAEFGMEVAEWMIASYQWSTERAPWPDYVGGYYKLPQELPAMQSFCYSEGTAAAYAIALRYAPERAERFAMATREAIRFLDVMQFDEGDSYYVARPHKVRGGVKYAMNENKIRIDYVGHGLSTLVQWLDARALDPVRPPVLHDPADLARPAGFEGSVPGLDYGAQPRLPP